MNESNLPQRRDESVSITPSSLLSDKLRGRLKKIVVNKCDLCQIGIGESMLYYEGTWRKYKHDSKKAYEYKYKNTKLRLCIDCFEKLTSMKEVDKYLRKNLPRRGKLRVINDCIKGDWLVDP